MVVGLAAMRRATFAYALANGTIGVYDQPGQRKWRVKSKHEACAIVGFDLDGDGQPEVITGWSSGKLEVRSYVTASNLTLHRSPLTAHRSPLTTHLSPFTLTLTHPHHSPLTSHFSP